MPHYHSQGEFPSKRHVQFRQSDGSLYAEQLISTEGFSDIYSLTYHIHPPTKIMKIDKPVSVKPDVVLDNNMQHRSYKTFNVDASDDYIAGITPLLVNDTVRLSVAAPRHSMKDYFFRNAQFSEILFVHVGSGVLSTIFGDIRFGYGDHLVIPRGTTYQLHFETEDNRFFIIESATPFRFPKRYTNDKGQLLEHAPFYERDIRKPEDLKTFNETGDFRVVVKKGDQLFPYHYATHPFDVVGWDGYLYPYAFSIHDFEPITGRIHQPPPVHQTFETDTLVMCAFVPRMYDYHPLSIPTPYNHSNIDSDEVLYYVDGDFMSRKHVERGQITLHPIGIPHGPHPGTVEKSIGKTETRELAVMVDTFQPLHITRQAMKIEDEDYFKSWLT